MGATIVQGVASTGTTSTNLTLTLPNPTTPGNTLIFVWGSSSTVGVSAGSGGGVTTWAKTAESKVRRSCSLWSGLVDTTPAAAATLTHSSAARNGYLFEVSGLKAGATPIVGTNNGQNANAAASVTPTAGKQYLIVAVEGSQVNTNSGPTNSFTPLYANGSIGPSGYRILTADGSTYSTGWGTGNSFAIWDECIVAFEIAGFQTAFARNANGIYVPGAIIG